MTSGRAGPRLVIVRWEIAIVDADCAASSPLVVCCSVRSWIACGGGDPLRVSGSCLHTCSAEIASRALAGRAGAFFSVCATGALRAAVDERWEARRTRLASGNEPIVGVSVYAAEKERAPDPDPFDARAFVAGWRRRTAGAPTSDPTPPAHEWPRRYLDLDVDGGEAAATEPAPPRSTARADAVS